MKAKTLINLYWFCQVVEYGGFVAASQQTRASAPTLSRAVAALEASCGEKLLHRNAKQFHLTSAGEDYYQRFAPLLKQVDDQWLDVSNSQAELSGDIHVSCTVPFTEFFLQGRAIEFMQAHPSVNIVIHYAQDTHDFIEANIDLAIVNTTIKEPYLVQKKLFEVPVGFAAAPDYLKRYGTPVNATELASHHLLLSGSTNTAYWRVEQHGKVHKIPLKPKYQINNFNLIHEATVAGLGICLMPLPVLQGLEKVGKVVHLLKDADCPTNKTYVVWSDRKLIAARVKAFRDLIFERVTPAHSRAFIEKKLSG